MYVHVDRFNLAPGSGSGQLDPAAVAAAGSPPGLAGFLTLRQVAGTTAVRLTWWDTESGATNLPGLPTGPAGRTGPADATGPTDAPGPADATHPGGTTGVPPALTGETYQVKDVREGLAAGQAPAYARLVCFDGPRAPEEVAAGDLAGERRIWPAVRGISGLIRISLLRGRDLGSLIVILATSIEALDAGAEAIMATELLPDEDPALLPGPDRMELHQVTGYRLPAAAPAAAAGRR